MIGILSPGSAGGDSDAVCTPAIAKGLRSAGVLFLLRYLSRTTPQNTGDLSFAERVIIKDAGIAVGFVQHCPKSGWAPSVARGQNYGAAAVANLKEVGAAPGVCVWRDWEGVLVGSSIEDCISDINAWNAQVASGGYVPGIYFGFNGILDSKELYWRLTCKHYWKSESTVPSPVVRGWQMVQSQAPSPVPDYDWDRDVVMMDTLGGVPIWDLP